MKKRAIKIVSVCLVLAGLALLLYPTFSDRWNRMHQSRAISGYGSQVAQMDDGECTRILERARSYNEELWEEKNSRFLTGEVPAAEYDSVLNIGGSGIMGSLEIPSIGCRLPIYHGTDERALQAGAGHVSSSSLPVGGENTHCVLIGHRGLPSARLFTDLDKLREGDLFCLHVLDDTLIYRVEKIEIVLPEEVEKHALEEGEDRCTLVTCTPYGINTHRLLVEGKRLPESSAAATRAAETGDDSGIVFWLLAALAGGVLAAALCFWRKVRKQLTNF